MDKVTLLEYAEQFILEPTMKRDTMSPSYSRNVMDLIRRFCYTQQNDIPTGDELELSVRRFLLELKRSNGLSNSTCKLYAILLGRFMERFYLFTEVNRRRLCETFSYTAPTSSTKSIRPDELKQLFETLFNRGAGNYTALRDYLITGTGILTGMRVSQIVGLSNSLVDEHGVSLTTKRQKNKSQSDTTKIIPAGSCLPDGRNYYSFLKVFLAMRAKKVRDKDSSFLFCKLDGKPLTTDYVRKFMSKYGNIHPHQLRHTVATIVSHQVGVVQAAELLDHVNIQTTMRYVELESADSSRETIQVISNSW